MSAGRAVEPYGSSDAHLADELLWLDALIALRCRTLDLLNDTVPDEQASRSLCISRAEVDWHLRLPAPPRADDATTKALRVDVGRRRAAIDRRVRGSLERGFVPALTRLSHMFGLSRFEQDALMICAAPELRRKYDRLYAYLQDDITRRKPSVDLVLALLCDDEAEQWRARSCFLDQAPLMRAGLLQVTTDPQSSSGTSGRAQCLGLDPRLLGFLLGHHAVDARLAGLVTLDQPPAANAIPSSTPAARLLPIIRRHMGDAVAAPRPLVIHLHGPRGAGRMALAQAVCREQDCLLLRVDGDLLLARGADLPVLLQPLFREAVLLHAALYIDHADAWLKDANRAALKLLARALKDYGWLMFLAGDKPWPPDGLFQGCRFVSTALPMPDVPAREAAWRVHLDGRAADADAWPHQLAQAFRLTPGEIAEAVELAAGQGLTADGEPGLSLPILYAACRQLSNQQLGTLALKIEARHGWDDLVLPDDKAGELKEICNHLKHRHRVFGEWGFDRTLSYGKGLSALFFGVPGTGKTMAAQVIAREVGLDLFKIELSEVVSKYIGETEKNLETIFRHAQASNAILFFDEADALFGKRTEVADAHDRYANIETSYLLQRIEHYDGMVILATNLRENLDDAFMRRITFTVEFPFPDESTRLRLWRRHVPKEAPVSDAVDFEYLSRELKVAGGSIKNIVVNSAFLAAEDNGEIGMHHLLGGAKREFEKLGKLWSVNGAALRKSM